MEVLLIREVCPGCKARAKNEPLPTLSRNVGNDRAGTTTAQAYWGLVVVVVVLELLG